MNNEDALAIFHRNNWDGVDKDGLVSATKVCEAVFGAAPDAGWVDDAAKTGYWFVGSPDHLLHVTGVVGNWTITVERPKWISTQFQIQGAVVNWSADDWGPSVSVTITLTSSNQPTKPTELRATGHGARLLVRFFRDYLSPWSEG